MINVNRQRRKVDYSTSILKDLMISVFNDMQIKLLAVIHYLRNILELVLTTHQN
jgi:hypothetical protein